MVAASDGAAGRITVLYGAAGGLGSARAVLDQDAPGVPGHNEDGDGENGTGMVWRLPGSPAGLTGTGSAYYGAPAAPAVRFGVPLEG